MRRAYGLGDAFCFKHPAHLFRGWPRAAKFNSGIQYLSTARLQQTANLAWGALLTEPSRLRVGTGEGFVSAGLLLSEPAREFDRRPAVMRLTSVAGDGD